jgi:hypothetical protein
MEGALTLMKPRGEKPFKPSMDRPKGEWDPIHGKAPRKGTLAYNIWKQKVNQDKGVAEATGDTKFDTIMGNIVQKSQAREIPEEELKPTEYKGIRVQSAIYPPSNDYPSPDYEPFGEIIIHKGTVDGVPWKVTHTPGELRFHTSLKRDQIMAVLDHLKANRFPPPKTFVTPKGKMSLKEVANMGSVSVPNLKIGSRIHHNLLGMVKIMSIDRDGQNVRVQDKSGKEYKLLMHTLQRNKVTESLRSGEYHVWTVHFDDGTKKQVKVTWDETTKEDLQLMFPQKKIVKIDTDYTVHGDGYSGPSQVGSDPAARAYHGLKEDQHNPSQIKFILSKIPSGKLYTGPALYEKIMQIIIRNFGPMGGDVKRKELYQTLAADAMEAYVRHNVSKDLQEEKDACHGLIRD